MTTTAPASLQGGGSERAPSRAVSNVGKGYESADELGVNSPRFHHRGRTRQRLPPLRTQKNTSHSMSSLYSASPRPGFIKRSNSEDCLKCMLKIPHKKCEGHKYIRIGGGYRHSFLYIKTMLAEIELRREQALLQQQRLDAINEKGMKTIRTWIRTKSGRLVERLIVLTEEDYAALQAGGQDALDILRKYLSKDEADNLESYDKQEVKAITTFIRTKSGRLIEKVVYVSKDDYDAMKRGDLDPNDVIRKYYKSGKGEKIEGWAETKMKAVTTFIRTKSGRLIEKTILMTEEDYNKLQEMKKQGIDPSSLLNKYMSLEDGAKVESWEKKEAEPMKVIKTWVRTKSGRLIEKTIMLTKEEYEEFQRTGDVNILKKYMTDIDADAVIEGWEKHSTVYADSDDEDLAKAAAGTRIIGKDGIEYEVFVDPVTGKKYKKAVKKPGGAAGANAKKDGPRGKIKGKVGRGFDGEDPAEKNMTEAQKKAYRAGNRRDGSDSEYSYRSVISAGGTRHVKRRRRRADGTYSDEESYHSDMDVEGKKRRQKRRAERKAVAVKEAKKKYDQGGRRPGSTSDYSYRSVVSAGGTRHVKRRRRRADGTYSDEESYHSSQDEDGKKRRQMRRKMRDKKIAKGGRQAGSESDYSYRSVYSAGGTRHVRRKKRKPGGGYEGDSESYHSDEDEAGQARRRKRRAERQKAFKAGKRNDGSDSDYSYRSVISAGGTRHVRRKKKNADGTYGDSESYHSSQDEDGEARRRKRRRERKHAGSAHSYYSVVSEGGTRHVRRKKKNADGTYGDSESYHSSDSGMFENGGKGRKGKKGKKAPKKRHDSDSDNSYYSVVSAGGTRRQMIRKRIRDKDGKIIGHGDPKEYKEGDSDYSYASEYSAGGTRTVVKKKRIRDKDGNVVGYGKTKKAYHSDSSDSSYEYVSDGKGGKKLVKKDKKGKKGKNDGKNGKDGTKKPQFPKEDGYHTDFSGSLASTDPEDEPDLSKMTNEEREAYFKAKAQRKIEREKKRREKYGDKYDEMMEKHKKNKEIKNQSMVHYEKGRPRFLDEGFDERGIGLAHDDWGNRRKSKAAKGGGDDSEYEIDPVTGKKVKKNKGKDEDEESLYEYVRDEHGNIVRGADGKPLMKKIGKGKKGDAGEGYEYVKDAHGNLIRRKIGEAVDEPESDGDYFELDEHGNLVLKKGKKKIDISKLSEEDLKRLGIDPRTMSKQEIARILKEKFGADIQIEKGGQKVGLKNIDDYEDGHNTDDLANDSDLDISTLHGQKRVRVLMRRGGPEILAHMKKLIEDANLGDPETQHPDERDAEIDFLNHYRLVDPKQIDIYAKPFVVEDDDKDGVIYAREAREALEGIPAIHDISKKQMDYVIAVLGIDRETNVTFRMFAVMVALAERVTQLDQYAKEFLEISELIDIERKIEMYKAMFYCNDRGDRDINYIKAEDLKIELMAGGLNWEQQQFIMDRVQPNEWREVSFIDYLSYIPLFLSMHDKMVENPLDMSNNKYGNRPASTQRDINTLGYPLKKGTRFISKYDLNQRVSQEKANTLLKGGKRSSVYQSEGVDMFNKYQKLPNIRGTQSTPATATKKP